MIANPNSEAGDCKVARCVFPRAVGLAGFVLLAATIAFFASQPAAADELASGWKFPPGVNDVVIPSHFLTSGEIVVRMTIKGRGIDLTLDTGMDRNMLDGSVLSALGLSKPGETAATLDSVQFGDMTMRGLLVNPGSFYRRDEDDDLIVGVLGYDFLKDAVVKIDYDHQQVRILNPASFHAPKAAMQYSVYPDDKIPLVSAAIGNAQGGSFVIDTGATNVVVFPRLVLGTPNAFTSAQALSSNRAAAYYRFFWAVCGHIEMIPYSVDQVRVETVGVRNWVVWSAPSDSCFITKGLDGLLGFDFLRLFNVYIDYPADLVVLEPNAVYKSAPNTIKL